jgi:4-diphosphocytidyl-2-C-methyl-D-erythritol kinase
VSGGGVRALAPGKVNLSLALGPVRPDGRHELATLVQAISLADEVRLEPGAGEADEVVCAEVEGENLAARALGAFRATTGWAGPPVRLTIEKRVPVAAGMGGGSSDAAAALRLAAHAAGDQPDLLAIAARLGSDVPALLEPGLALATGAGERVRRLGALAPFAVLVLPSPHSLATADVYREADRLGLPRSAADLERARADLEAAAQPGTRLPPELLVNDLEAAARALCPPIEAALVDARAAGAAVAMVSGSGPTVFGLFSGADAAAAAEAAARELAPRHPGAIAAVPVGDETGAVEPAP